MDVFQCLHFKKERSNSDSFTHVIQPIHLKESFEVIESFVSHFTAIVCILTKQIQSRFSPLSSTKMNH